MSNELNSLDTNNEPGQVNASSNLAQLQFLQAVVNVSWRMAVKLDLCSRVSLIKFFKKETKGRPKTSIFNGTPHDCILTLCVCVYWSLKAVVIYIIIRCNAWCVQRRKTESLPIPITLPTQRMVAIRQNNLAIHLHANATLLFSFYVNFREFSFFQLILLFVSETTRLFLLPDLQICDASLKLQERWKYHRCLKINK